MVLPSLPREIELQGLELMSFTVNSPMDRLPLRSMRILNVFQVSEGITLEGDLTKTISH